MPIHKVEYPAFTICSQGQVKNVLDNAINKQFEEFVIEVKGKEKGKNRRKRDINLSQSTMDTLGLSTEEVEKLKKQFMQDYYPGLEMNQLVNLVGVLAADDPEKTLESKVITDPETILSSLGNYFEFFLTHEILAFGRLSSHSSSAVKATGKIDMIVRSLT